MANLSSRAVIWVSVLLAGKSNGLIYWYEEVKKLFHRGKNGGTDYLYMHIFLYLYHFYSGDTIICFPCLSTSFFLCSLTAGFKNAV